MKSNVQYIFDKITRTAPAIGHWDTLDKPALIELIRAIGATDRGIAISADKAALVAEAVLAARHGWPADLHRLRAALNHDAAFPAVASDPPSPVDDLPTGRERTGEAQALSTAELP